MNYDRDRFTVVSGEELPPPHSLFRCAHAYRLPGGEDNRDDQAAFPKFLAELSESDLEACPYHTPDIELICAVAVGALRERADLSDELVEFVGLREGASAEQTADAQHMFSKAIRYSLVTGLYTNGQHRACAIKAARIDECVVELMED